MQVYAARFDPTTKAPRIAILIAGGGLDETASENALHTLPAAVTLAVSPYAATPDAVVGVARQTGHEYLASIPMEPQGYALNDPANRALLTSAPLADNARLLDWALLHLAGYVGATGALGDMRGKRFAQVEDQMDPVLATLATRGLLYVDPRPGASPLPFVWSRTVDVVIDDPPTAVSIDARLAELEKHAHDTGVALGLFGAIRPVTMKQPGGVGGQSWGTRLRAGTGQRDRHRTRGQAAAMIPPARNDDATVISGGWYRAPGWRAPGSGQRPAHGQALARRTKTHANGHAL